MRALAIVMIWGPPAFVLVGLTAMAFWQLAGAVRRAGGALAVLRAWWPAIAGATMFWYAVAGLLLRSA